jgi:hypothetical protein
VTAPREITKIPSTKGLAADLHRILDAVQREIVPSVRQAADRFNTLIVGLYGETIVSPASGVLNVAFDDGLVQRVTLESDVTEVEITAPQAQPVGIVILVIEQSGGFAITGWPTIAWEGGATPVITVTAGAKDIVCLVYVGTEILGGYRQNYS